MITPAILSRRIDPVIGVEQACPGKATGLAAVRDRPGIDHVAEPPFQPDARKQIDVVRKRGVGRSHHADVEIADLVLTPSTQRSPAAGCAWPRKLPPLSSACSRVR